MQDGLEIYEAQLQQIAEVCADPWFKEQLALSRAGDEDALRRISGSCLRLVLDICRKRWRADGPLELLELVQEGNHILVRTVKRFSGSDAQQFLREVRQNVEAWFTLLFEHPGWARERWDRS
jgi:DNA-directed RNA polymerase sigma subunit (sigma70/sigma32)